MIFWLIISQKDGNRKQPFAPLKHTMVVTESDHKKSICGAKKPWSLIMVFVLFKKLFNPHARKYVPKIMLELNWKQLFLKPNLTQRDRANPCLVVPILLCRRRGWASSMVGRTKMRFKTCQSIVLIVLVVVVQTITICMDCMSNRCN